MNVSGTENLPKACADQDLREFVLFSTIAVYGMGEGSPLTESTPVNPENSYARSKLEADRRVLEFFQNDAAPSTIFRMSLVYSEGERGNFLRMLHGVDTGRFLLVGTVQRSRA